MTLSCVPGQGSAAPAETWLVLRTNRTGSFEFPLMQSALCEARNPEKGSGRLSGNSITRKGAFLVLDQVDKIASL